MTDDMTPGRRLNAALRDLKTPEISPTLMARILRDADATQALEAARRTPSAPSELLMARIARDAARAQAAMQTTEQAGRWLGPSAWAGLIAAGIAGLAIGLADPGGAASAAWPSGDTLAMNALIPAYDFQYLEGE